MPNQCEDCKANAVEIARATAGTPTAKLIAILVAHGVSDNRELAAIVGISLRAIQHARATHCAAAQPIARNPLRKTQPIASADATHCVSAQPIALAQSLHSRAGATNELPSEVLFEEKIVYPLTPTIAEPPLAEAVTAPPRKPSRSPTNRGSRLDPNWQLPDDWRMWARTIFPASTDATIAEQAAVFRDYWISKPGAQACKLDWEATWRNWCRKGLSAAGSVRQPQHTGVFGRSEPQPIRLSAAEYSRREAERMGAAA